MTDTLQYQVLDKEITMSSQLFDDIIKQYTETQSWSKIKSLVDSTNHQNCNPDPRIVSYLKRNLVYCFDTQMRSILKESIETFETRFFSEEQRRLRR